jgi:hypothetical protein
VITDSSFQPYVIPNLRRIILTAVNVNPEKRFQSALQMRRELEKINLKGFTVTSDLHGNFIVNNHNYLYSYNINTIIHSCINFIVKKTNISTLKETKSNKFYYRIKIFKDIQSTVKRFFSSIFK